MFVGGGTAAAFSFGLTDPFLSRATAGGGSASVEFPDASAQANSVSDPRHQGGLVVHDQKGHVNQLVPLGISLSGSSGNEIVVLEGLVEGTEVSAGTSLSSSRWSLPAKDLEQAFVSAPKDFNGTMELIAKLYSAANELERTTILHLEWDTNEPASATPPHTSGQASPLAPAAPQPPTPAPAAFTLAAVPEPKASAVSLESAHRPGSLSPKINAVTGEAAMASTRSRSDDAVDALLQVGRRLLRQGDIAAARVALRRAAEARSAEAARELAAIPNPPSEQPPRGGSSQPRRP